MAQARGRYVSDPGPRFDDAKAANEWAEGNPAAVLDELIGTVPATPLRFGAMRRGES